jgi:hypothetical protein
MDKTALVDSDIKTGQEIVTFLTGSNFPMNYALWLYSPDKYDEWRLVIATKLYDDEGPLSAYKKLNDILREKGEKKWILWSERIQLVSPEDTVIKSLKKDYPPDKPLLNPSFSGSTSCNTYIESAYLYAIPKSNS